MSRHSWRFPGWSIIVESRIFRRFLYLIAIHYDYDLEPVERSTGSVTPWKYPNSRMFCGTAPISTMLFTLPGLSIATPGAMLYPRYVQLELHG